MTPKIGQILTEIFDFLLRWWTTWAESTLKSEPFNTENKAQTLSKQVQKNFEKVEKSIFLTTKMVKITPQAG